MRKLILLFLAFILLVPVCSSAEVSSDSNYEAARAIANFMETHYGITILIGDECASADTGDIIPGDKPGGRTPFQELLGGKCYEHEIQIIDDAFSIYPGGFFEHFTSSEAPRGLRILLADQIIHEGNSVAGVTTMADGYCNIFLGVGQFKRINVHHELWHAIEFRILEDDPHTFDNWDELNPEGFEYSEDYTALNRWEEAAEKDEYFFHGYSTIDAEEDRATVIEALFLRDEAWGKAHPGIIRKYNRMMDAARPIFGEIYSEGE